MESYTSHVVFRVICDGAFLVSLLSIVFRIPELLCAFSVHLLQFSPVIL